MLFFSIPGFGMFFLLLETANLKESSRTWVVVSLWLLRQQVVK
jgi:hypothetical protein